MPTPLETRIIQSRKAQGIIVPALQEFAKVHNLGVQDELDARFVNYLIIRGLEREATRQNAYVFSPSSLAQCLRQVFLKRNHLKYGLVPSKVIRPEANSYFAKGDFTHLQWQLAIWKMCSWHPDFEFVDAEVPVMGRMGDHGGTIDIILKYLAEPIIIDVKGINVRSFQNVVRGNIPEEYRIQIGDYMVLANADKKLPLKFKRAIMLAESKGGPDINHPLGLHEVEFRLEDVKPEIHLRLGALREAESKGEIPDIECTSTRTVQYQGCPFRKFCKKEVKAREDANRRDPTKLKVAVPAPRGSNSSRRPRR